MKKEELYLECRNEKVTDDTVYIWHEYEMISVPSASNYAGEWIWSSDVNKLFMCYNNCILWNYLQELCSFDKEITDDMTLLDLISIYEANNEATIHFKLLKSIVEKTISIFGYQELCDYINMTTGFVQRLNLECDTYVCSNFDKVIEQVEIHNEGIIPVYETK